MAEYRKQTIIASVIAAVIALSAGLGIYFAQPPSTTSSTTVPPSSIIIGNHPAILIGAETTNSTTGLELSVLLNTSSFAPGQTVSINVTEYNTLHVTNNVTRASNWPLSGMTLGPCGTLNYPFGVSVFQGYYDQGNFSLLANQSSLALFAPGTYPCPAILVFSSYIFSPQSENASLGVAPNSTLPAFPMTSDLSINGTWTQNSGPAYHEFAPGNYTVVAGDEWGDVVLVHFSVAS